MSEPDLDLQSLTPEETTTTKHSSLVLILSVVVVAVGMLILVGNITISIYQDHQHDREVERLALSNSRSISEHEKTISLLCDRGYMIDGIVLTLIQLIERPPNDRVDRVFADRLGVYHLQLLDQVTNEESPCVQD